MKVNELIGELLAYPMNCDVLNRRGKEIILVFHKDYELDEEWVEMQ